MKVSHRLQKWMHSSTVSFGLTKFQEELCLQIIFPLQTILQSLGLPKSVTVAHVLGKSQITHHQHFYLPRENWYHYHFVGSEAWNKVWGIRADIIWWPLLLLINPCDIQWEWDNIKISCFYGTFSLVAIGLLCELFWIGFKRHLTECILGIMNRVKTIYIQGQCIDSKFKKLIFWNA